MGTDIFSRIGRLNRHKNNENDMPEGLDVDFLEGYLGRTVILTTTTGGIFRGDVARIDQTIGKIVLKNVTIDGSKLLGPQFFLVGDIASLEFDADESEDVVEGSKKNRVSDKWKERILKKKIHQPHLSRLRNLDTDDITTKKMVERCMLEEEEIPEENEEYEDFYKVEDCTMICRPCKKFEEAIEYLLQQDVVAMEFRGVDSGRDGILSLIQCGTDTDVIIFDVLRMGRATFDRGLADVMESSKVTKVIHDCRWSSDLLYHQFDVTLNNVFDTQVADAHVYSLCQGGDWPRHVQSLTGCLNTHLGLQEGEIFMERFRERLQKKDQSIWLQRPVPSVLLEMTCRNTRHMTRLQYVLIDKMLLVFKVGVKLFLNHVKDATPDRADKYKANRHLLPYAFVDMKKYVDMEVDGRAEFDYQRKEKKHKHFDGLGFRENLVPLGDRTIIRSHDSIWHRSEEFYQGFRNRPVSDDKQPSGGPAEERRRGNPQATRKPPSPRKELPPTSTTEAKRKENSQNEKSQNKNPVALDTTTTKTIQLPQTNSESTSSPVATTSTPKRTISAPRARSGLYSTLLALKKEKDALSSQTVSSDQTSPIPDTSVSSAFSPPSPSLQSAGSESDSSSSSHSPTKTTSKRLKLLEMLKAKKNASAKASSPVVEVSPIRKPVEVSQTFMDIISAPATQLPEYQTSTDTPEDHPLPQSPMSTDYANDSPTSQVHHQSSPIIASSNADNIACSPTAGSTQVQHSPTAFLGSSSVDAEGCSRMPKLEDEAPEYSASVEDDSGFAAGHASLPLEARSSPASYFGFDGSGSEDSDKAQQREASVVNYLPAGLQSTKMSDKQMRQLEHKSGPSEIELKEKQRLAEAKMSSSVDLEDDFGVIPTPNSLKRRGSKPSPLGVSAIGDPFIDDINPRLDQTSSGTASNSGGDDSEFEIVNVDEFEKTEKFKKITMAAKSIMSSEKKLPKPLDLLKK